MKTTRKRDYATRGGGGSLPTASVLCLVAFIPVSCTQNAPGTASTTNIASLTKSLAVVTQTLGLTKISVHGTTALSSKANTHNTTSSAMSTPTEHIPPDLFPTATHSSDVHVQEETVFNYYFLFLAAFVVLIAALLWWLHRQRKRRKEQMRLSGHNALTRDLEGWAGTRRFVHGRYGRYQAAQVRREEGLNEHGEAPPPYQPKSEIRVAQESARAPQDHSSDLSIPLRTLTRDEADRVRPPGYSATSGANVPTRTRSLPSQP